jgi:hypothetical protein
MPPYTKFFGIFWRDGPLSFARLSWRHFERYNFRQEGWTERGQKIGLSKLVDGIFDRRFAIFLAYFWHDDALSFVRLSWRHFLKDIIFDRQLTKVRTEQISWWYFRPTLSRATRKIRPTFSAVPSGLRPPRFFRFRRPGGNVIKLFTAVSYAFS